ncbi:MAG: glycosyltransferase family 4 protein [Patescibacteria group bacterium]
MNLLIITQKVDRNDPILGFFHRWLEEFAKNAEKLTVICLEKGEYNLPENVNILSLGKENGKSRIKYLRRFYKYIWRERNNYNAVFAHMNPEYIILGGLVWKIMGKKIAFWYVHKAVNLKLKIAEKLADKIFTASRESFRLPSKKVQITGHGIDIDKFSIFNFQFSKKIRIVTAGRIAPVKNLDILIEAAEILKNKGVDFQIKIAGSPIIEADKIYFEKLKSEIRQKNLENFVFFAGPIPYSQIQDFYRSGDIFVNLSETGSVDKAVLEAMACGLSIATSNQAFKNILPHKYFLEEKNPEALAQKLSELSAEKRPDFKLREIALKEHSLQSLIPKIIKELES